MSLPFWQCIFYHLYKFLFRQGETEWQRFLRESIESVAKVAELAPLHIYALVVSHVSLP